MGKFQIFLMVVFFSIKDSAQGRDQHRLYNDLFRDYCTVCRPVINDSEVLTIRLGLSFLQIMDVDETNQILTSNIWLHMYWNDSYLVWNPSEYSGLDAMRLPSSRLWKPDILLYNSADEKLDFAYQTNVLIDSSGGCTQILPGISKSMCHIDMRWFPFDVQKCELKFGSWTHGSWTLDLQMVEADISSYTPSGEWDLIEIKGRINKQKYACCEEMYPEVSFTVVMKRRTLYYLLSLLLPCVLLNTLALLVFVLPADSGEKITLGITVLLSLTVFMLLVAQIMPPTSESVPLIAQYIASVVVIVALSVIATAIVLQHHYHDPRGEKMPKWSRVLLLNWCARFLRMKRPCAEQEALRSLELTVPGPKPTYGSELCPSTDGLKTDSAGRAIGRAGEGEIAMGSSAGNMEAELAKLLDEVHSIGKHFQKQDVDVAVRNEWKFAALVIDRLCLVAFSVITILCTIRIFMSAPSFD